MYSSMTIRAVTATLAAIDHHYPTRSAGSLLTTTNPKLQKDAVQRGYLTAGLFLAPATMSGSNVCPWSTPDCVAGCLNTAGRGGIGLDASGWNALQAARIRRTCSMILEPDAFDERLTGEILRHARTAKRHGLTPALRLNGTSDIAWHKTRPHIIDAAKDAGCILYDYTKRPRPDASWVGIDITYSYPGGNGDTARRYLESGHRVAVVFTTRKGEDLPAEWVTPWGDAYPVIDGDAHDLRFLDPGSVIVGLRAKGRLRTMQATPDGFLQAA